MRERREIDDVGRRVNDFCTDDDDVWVLGCVILGFCINDDVFELFCRDDHFEIFDV